MNELTVIHIAAGVLALAAGTLAAVAGKGGRMHARAGTLFVSAMLALGVTAAILEPMRTPTPGSPVGGFMICYFVATAWVAGRRRDGVTGKFELAAAAVALGVAGLIILGGLTGTTTPAGAGPVFALGGICLLAGLLDLNAALRGKLTAAQRLSRHLWRMCFAFFIATGSFFLGQQDVLPAGARGSPLLFVLAFAPFALMLFWLVRLRFAKAVRQLVLRTVSLRPAKGAAQ
jgi:hypothetical protein